MPEIFSSKKILIQDIKVVKTDAFNRVLTGKETASEIESNRIFPNVDVFTSESIQKNIPKTLEPSNINTLNQSAATLLLPSKMLNPFAKTVDISDKLAAIYGEKEKDIKDKLSDIFKKLVLIPFNLISEVDTSMGQKEHNKQKKIKERKPENQNHEIDTADKKFSLKQWINYKLLEIVGELLYLSRKFAEKNKNIKKRIYKEFKKFKKKMIFTLQRIDSLIESNK